MATSICAFTGEYQDPVTAGYPLGDGYRWHSPPLMRFNAPDDSSPFGAGGANPYAYCEADPINRSDPSGHYGNTAWFGEVATREESQLGTQDAGRFTGRSDANADMQSAMTDNSIAASRAAHAAAAPGPSGVADHQYVAGDATHAFGMRLEEEGDSMILRGYHLANNAKRYGMTEFDLLLDQVEVIDDDIRPRMGGKMARVAALVRHLKLIGKRLTWLDGYNNKKVNLWAGYELEENVFADAIANEIKKKLKLDNKRSGLRNSTELIYKTRAGPARAYWLDVLYWLGDDSVYTRKMKAPGINPETAPTIPRRRAPRRLRPRASE